MLLGFVFIETVVAIVILTSSILLLYSTFNKILQSEKTRVDYDDISYIYRSYHIKNRFSKLNMVEVINKLKDDNNKYFLTIGTETE